MTGWTLGMTGWTLINAINLKEIMLKKMSEVFFPYRGKPVEQLNLLVFLSFSFLFCKLFFQFPLRTPSNAFPLTPLPETQFVIISPKKSILSTLTMYSTACTVIKCIVVCNIISIRPKLCTCPSCHEPCPPCHERFTLLY